MPNIHLEIEKKYDAAATDTVPELTGVAGIEAVEQLPARELVAVYFDTPDLRLTAGRVTLRRRTGGSDDGWHLKLPLAMGRRLEVRRAAGRSASRPPKSLLDLVRAHVGTAELVAVATLRTTRQVTLLHGPAAPVAEVADDTVHAVRHLDGEESAWREIEVELVTGGPEQLAELDGAMRAAGLAPAVGDSKAGRVLAPTPAGTDRTEHRLRRRSTTEDVVAARIRTVLRDLQMTDPLVRTRVADAVPKLAQVLQDLRGLLAAFRRHLAVEELAAVEETVRSVGAAASLASLLPAAEEDLRRGFDAEPADLVPGGARRDTVARLGARRRAATSELIRTLGQPGYATLLDHLAGWADAPPVHSGGRAGDVLAEVIDREVRRLRRRVRRLKAADPGSWERVEDAAVRLSAAVDAGRPVLGQRLTALAATVADLHRHVAAAARARVLQQQLLDLARHDPGLAAGAFSLGRVHARQDRVVRRARRDLRRAARQLGQEAAGLR